MIIVEAKGSKEMTKRTIGHTPDKLQEYVVS